MSIFQTMIQTSTSGWAYHKMLFDDEGLPVDYVFLDVNPAFEEQTGLIGESVMGKKVTEVIPGIENFKPDLISLYGEVALTGKPNQIQIYFEPFHKYYSVKVTSPEKGYFITEFLDVTEIKRKETEYQTIVQSSFDGFWVCDLKGKLIDVNDAFCNTLGYSRDELLTMSVTDFEAVENPEETAAHLQKVIREGKDRFETKHRRKDGKILDIEINATYLKEGEGKFFVFNTDITGKKLQERILRESEEKYKTLTESSQDYIFNVDSNFTVRFVNQCAAELFRSTPEKLAGKQLNEIFPPQIAEKQSSSIKQVFESGKGFSTVAKSTFPTGEVWLHTTLSPIKNELGNVISVMGVSRDVTQQKNAEQKLIESEEKYRNLFDNVSIPLCYVSEGGVIESFNNRFIKLFGYTKKDIPTLTEWWILAYPDETYRKWVIENWENAVQNSIEKGIDIKSDMYNVTCKNGEVRQIIIAGITLEKDFLATFIDVTELKRAEEDLLESEKKYHTLYEQTPDLLVSVDTQTLKITECNQTFLNEMGFTREEAIGKPVVEIYDPESMKEVEETIKKFFDEGYIKNRELRFKRKDGSVFDISLNITAIRDEKGKIVHSVSTSRNITEQKKAATRVLLEKEFSDKVIDVLPGIFYLFDEKGKFIRWNRALSGLSGFSNDEISLKSPLDFIAPHHHDKITKAIQKTFNEGKVFVEADFLSANGNKIPFYFTGIRIDLNGNPHLLGVGIDLTQRKKAEQALVESEKRLSNAITDSPFPVMIHAEGGEVIQISNSWTEITGYTHNNINRIEKWLELAYGMNKKSVEEVIHGLYKTDAKTREGEFEITCRNGEKRIWDFSSSPIGKTSDGRRLIMSMANDVTVRKHAEERILRSESNLKIILDSLPFGSVIIGTDRKIRSVNKAALQMMGYENADEVVDSACYQTFCPNCDNNCPVWDLQHHLDKADKILITKHKKEIPILKSAIPVVLDNEKVLLETFVDISSLKKLQAEKEELIQSVQERIKEIRCLYQINEIFRHDGLSVKERLNETIRLIPGGWQFPEKTCVRLVFDEFDLQTENYTQTKFTLKENISIDNIKRGTFWVGFTDNSITENPFLKEEIQLLREIAFNIGRFVNKYEYEKILVESEKKFRQLIQNSPLPIVLTDDENNIELVNNSFEEIIGYTINELRNIEDWWNLAYPAKEYRKEIENKWVSAMEEAVTNKRSSVPVEARVLCKNGKERIFSIIGSLIGNKNLVIFNDLTDRINAEEERDRFFTVSLDLLCIAGTDGYFKRLNPAWEKLLGWTTEELTSKPFLDFIHPDDLDDTLKEIEKLSDGRSALYFTNRYRCKDGTYKWLSWNSAPFGDILYAVATDITELKQTKDRILELNTRLNMALEGGNVGVWEWNLETGVTIWDNRMEEMFGLEPNSFNGTYEAFIERVYPEDVELVEEAIEKALSGEKEYDVVYRLKWKNRENHFINAKADVIKNHQNKNVKMIGICIDVTEIKVAELKLQIIADELKRSNQELEQFAYVASHDLQQPLRMVASYTQLLEKKFKDKIDDKANKYIHYAVDGANRMQILIDDLLSYSRVTTKGKEFTTVDTNQSVMEAIKDLQVILKERNGKVTFDQLPEIKGDASQIKRLFQNLIENGLKFNNSTQPLVHISAERKGKNWLFSVTDNGIGIDRKFEEKVFVIFQRLHNRDEYEGTGMGLALCKRIVNRHEGEIWFESEKNQGTTFYFTTSYQN